MIKNLLKILMTCTLFPNYFQRSMIDFYKHTEQFAPLYYQDIKCFSFERGFFRQTLSTIDN